MNAKLFPFKIHKKLKIQNILKQKPKLELYDRLDVQELDWSCWSRALDVTNKTKYKNKTEYEFSDVKTEPAKHYECYTIFIGFAPILTFIVLRRDGCCILH